MNITDTKIEAQRLRAVTFAISWKSDNQYDFVLRCAPDVIAFLFMFQIVFMAFAQFAYLIFGTKLKDFSTVIDAA